MQHYGAFEVCSITVNGQSKRGARAICSRCGGKDEIFLNTQRSSGSGEDTDIITRGIATKFERLGWQTGKTLICPKHVVLEKKTMKPIIEIDKVVQMSSAAPPRLPTRDEKRIIFQKIDEFYVGETVGYEKNWSDEKVAKDLNVPVAWVATIREENFGPNMDEETAAVTAEAKALVEEIKTTLQAWNVKDDIIEKSIQKIANRK
jgi:hypothetical protein